MPNKYKKMQKTDINIGEPKEQKEMEIWIAKQKRNTKTTDKT